MRYWLMKTEPSVYSIDDLAAERKTIWDGVRNYQARNTLRDDIKVGDKVLFYHSSAHPPGVAGMAVVSKESFPDPTAFDPDSLYYDAQSTVYEPRWFSVEVEFKSKFKNFIPLATLKKTKGLENMLVTKKGVRLSVQPCSKKEYDIVVALGNKKT